MMTVSEAIEKMAGGCGGSQYDVNHFLKVWAYAKTIGELEGLDERTQSVLEYAAIVHDIACPSLREIHGNAPGKLQEEAGPPLARKFYEDSGLDTEIVDRVCWLVGHHHTLTEVDGLDHRILLEADFLVNAGEGEASHETIDRYRENVFRTESGLRLLDTVYPE